jgi:hypothetical protein
VLGLLAGAVTVATGGTVVAVGWAVMAAMGGSVTADVIDNIFEGLDSQTGGGSGTNGNGGNSGGGGANACRYGFEDIVMVETGQILRICKENL